ncbi:MAG: polysaccharide deacetylase family protein [Proteobacteria bacterium]|nr:polysaccharide deacetylase family protein [Pseudomonadota bacterium]
MSIIVLSKSFDMRIVATLSTTGAVFLSVLLLMGLTYPTVAQQPGTQRFWPVGVSGAVSLTFDDGMPSQLKNAVPALDRYGIKATFYVNPNYSIDWHTNIPAWSRVGASGHELGNHTDRHTCSCRHDFGDNRSFCLERITIADIAQVIDAGSAVLRETFDHELRDQSFAYPCYESFAGAGLRRKSYVPEVANRYLAGRAGEDRGNDPVRADISHLSSYSVDGRTFEQIITIIEQDLAHGRWVILTFHGVSGDWLSIDLAVLERLLKYLQQQRPRIWTGPVITVARYVDERRGMLDQTLK